jgi:hypothetical protein
LGQNPTEFTATMASSDSAKRGNRSTDMCASSTRWARMAAALRLLAWRTMTSEWSMP